MVLTCHARLIYTQSLGFWKSRPIGDIFFKKKGAKKLLQKNGMLSKEYTVLDWISMGKLQYYYLTQDLKNKGMGQPKSWGPFFSIIHLFYFISFFF